MMTIVIAVFLLAAAIGVLYALSYCLVLAFERLERAWYRRGELTDLTLLLHELLAEVGRPPVRTRRGRHRLRRTTDLRHRPAATRRRAIDTGGANTDDLDSEDADTDTYVVETAVETYVGTHRMTRPVGALLAGTDEWLFTHGNDRTVPTGGRHAC